MYHPIFPFVLFSFMNKTFKLPLRGIDICNINISRRAKGTPDRPASVVYPFVTALFVGTRGACLYGTLATSCTVYMRRYCIQIII